MSIGSLKYRLDDYGKIRKIWAEEGEVVTIPKDFNAEVSEKLWDKRTQRWVFDDIIFEYCAFDFLQTYVFIACTFRNCDMSGINPSRAVLTNEITGCINVRGSSFPVSGDFTGYKIAYDVWTSEPVLIALYVPKDADRRGNGFDKKFRVSSAVVVDMRFADGEKCQRAYSAHNPYFHYNLHDIVAPEYGFNYNLHDIVAPEYGFNQSYVPCASGIHMFLDPEDAIDYADKWGPHVRKIPRSIVIENQRARLGLINTPTIWNKMKAIQKEDGPCPYPERLGADKSGDWSWVNTERKDR